VNPAAILREVAHRPWPLPRGRWAMTMRWFDLAFLHWPVPAAALRPLVPAPLAVDTFEGTAWIGVVPFRMDQVRLRLAPAVPTTSAFPEINVRTYVRSADRSGVWFFSLDAASRLAVRMARLRYNLPYFDARIDTAPWGEGVEYRSRRTHRGALSVEFTARSRPAGPVFHAAPGTLEHWLAERYALFTADRRGRVSSVDVQHAPWPLQRAEAEVERCTLLDGMGIRLPDTAPLAHFARSVEVLSWGRVPVPPTTS